MLDGQGQMFLYTGWGKFTRALNLEVGFLLNFFSEGDVELTVKVFDETSCYRH
jgi:hypothetical protein